MSPECRDGKYQPDLICPSCGKKAITKIGDFFQCCSNHGGCGYGGLEGQEFKGQRKLFG